MVRCGYRRAAVAGLVLALAAISREASAYEFDVFARTIGQAFSLEQVRLSGTNSLDRRLITQTLSLEIWDIGSGTREVSPYRRRAPGPKLTFKSTLRVDHDFGSYTGGQSVYNGREWDAIDLAPELEEAAVHLDVLYAYAAAEHLFDDRIDVYVGRLLSIQSLDWFSMDGIKVRGRVPRWLMWQAFGGLRVRESTPLSHSRFEPDGTSRAECAEYVEGAVPGSGAWRGIDRPVMADIRNNQFRNDFDRCPQREEVMPTYGGALETTNLRHIFARASYRRSISKTVGLIGAPDRFEFPDTGLYPNGLGQAPGYGVNEEHVTAHVRGMWQWPGKRQIVPYGAARYSVLHGLVDEAFAGARVRLGQHVIEPELYYSYPTFDGDSIFNVFSTSPYADARATYTLSPEGTQWQAYVRGWARAFFDEDEDGADDDSTTTAGVHVGTRFYGSRSRMFRADAFFEDGYGGRRYGTFAQTRYRLNREFGLIGMATATHADDDVSLRSHRVSTGTLVGTVWNIHRGVTLTGLAEHTYSNLYNHGLRLYAILDLSFQPET